MKYSNWGEQQRLSLIENFLLVTQGKVDWFGDEKKWFDDENEQKFEPESLKILHSSLKQHEASQLKHPFSTTFPNPMTQTRFTVHLDNKARNFDSRNPRILLISWESHSPPPLATTKVQKIFSAFLVWVYQWKRRKGRNFKVFIAQWPWKDTKVNTKSLLFSSDVGLTLKSQANICFRRDWDPRGLRWLLREVDCRFFCALWIWWLMSFWALGGFHEKIKGKQGSSGKPAYTSKRTALLATTEASSFPYSSAIESPSRCW